MRQYSRARTGWLLGLLIPLYAHAAQGQERNVVREEFAVRPGGTVHFDLDHGNIEVEVVRENVVTITLGRTARGEGRESFEDLLEHHEYSFNKSGNDIRVHSRFEGEGRGMRWRKRAGLRVHLEVQVPEEFNVAFENGAGNVNIAKLSGNVTGATGAGNVIIEKLTGTVEIASGAGNLDISGDISSASIRTGAGNIDLSGQLGALDVTSGAGNIYAEIARQPQEDSELRTGAGNVTVELADDLDVDVVGTASLGSADCEFPIEVTGKLIKKSFSGKINAGGPQLKMHAVVGNVTLKRL